MIPQRIVAIGTSAFFGLGDPLHGGFIGRLKQWHERKGSDNELYNLGVSKDSIGETTSELLERLPSEAKVREPHLILLTSGINDIRRHGNRENPSITSKEKFRSNLISMIHEAKILADVVVVSPIPILEKHDSADNYLLPEDLKVYMQVVKDVCEEEHIPYLDVYNEWLTEDHSQFLTPDGVHPNEQGHEKIFESLKELLEKLYQ
ncbi:MAG TPA: GDSL-type esterase/lipase family protein [Candidatus Saccharimonadales bacterium]|nr:GDSL-type esterase/lipase family protein [Candidatus Saccharimonadales bacterium]